MGRRKKRVGDSVYITGWYYVKFEDNLNFCFLTNPKKFVPLSIDYGSLSLRTHFLLLFKLPALAAA